LPTDPDNNISLYEWDLNNDGQYDAVGKTTSFSAPDNGTFTVYVKVTDAGGLNSIASATVTVKNVSPVITALSLNNYIRVGTVVNARATFRDAGIYDTFTATWKWGDGTTSNGTVNNQEATGSHTYTKSGSYTVNVSIVDKDGGIAQKNKYIYVFP
jgi:PKD repeat protein